MAKALADMNLFSPIKNAQAVVQDRGVFQQVDIYERGGTMFVACRRGLVRMLHGGLTTATGLRWEAIDGVEYRETYNGPRVDAAEDSKRAA